MNSDDYEELARLRKMVRILGALCYVFESSGKVEVAALHPREWDETQWDIVARHVGVDAPSGVTVRWILEILDEMDPSQ